MSSSRLAAVRRLLRTGVTVLRRPALSVAGVAGAALMLYAVNGHYPISQWLFWRMTWVWLWTVLFALSSLSVGHTLMQRLVSKSLPVGEHLVQSMALGVFAFFSLTFIGGLLGLFGHAFAIALPLILLAATGYPLWQYLRRTLRHLTWLRSRRSDSWSVLRWTATAAGLISVVAIYLTILTPQNVSFDSLWYHLPIAEAYVAQGAIRPFVEGWYLGAYPHLASILYAWGFQLPFMNVVYRIEIAAHIEFMLFLWTLAAVPVLVRRLLHGSHMPHAWVVMFLFPGIFLYDSSLCVGADHVTAFFAIPIWLALLRYWPRPSPRTAMLLGITISGALLSKYTASTIAALPIVAATLRGVWLLLVSAIRKKRRGTDTHRFALALGTFAVTGIVGTTPHWLMNFIWYGDPVYPILHAHMHVHPWTADSTQAYRHLMMEGLWAPKGTPLHKLWETIKVVFEFSFKPHDWNAFHGKVPVFGFLFTLSTGLLLFLRKPGRIWALTFGGWSAVILWFWLHHQDRYLQAALPWMVAVTAAVLWKAWHEGLIARVAVVLLIAVQIIWGGDIYFFRTHTMIHDNPLKKTVDFIAMGHRKKYDRRTQVYGSWFKVGEKLPAGAKVLLHEMQVHFGIGHVTVDDWPGIQGGISYGRYRDVRDLHEALTHWGITHVMWISGKSRTLDSISGDLLFFDYALNIATHPQTIIGRRLAQLPPKPPARPANDVVAYLGCGKHTYQPGLYHRGTMTVLGTTKNATYPKPFVALGKGDAQTPSAAIAQARYVVLNKKCHRKVLTSSSLQPFARAARRHNEELWIRSSASSSKTGKPKSKPATSVPHHKGPRGRMPRLH